MKVFTCLLMFFASVDEGTAIAKLKRPTDQDGVFSFILHILFQPYGSRFADLDKVFRPHILGYWTMAKTTLHLNKRTEMLNRL